MNFSAGLTISRACRVLQNETPPGAASARPGFPSVTSPGLASLWTGAYGDVSGISANSQPMLPRDRHTLLEGTSGYLVTGLRAEPLWISAGAPSGSF